MGNFYGILPSFIRYDQELPPACKILYAEIASHLDFKGVFTASNELLAQLYSVTPQTISSWLKTLKNAGYIEIYYPGDENFEGSERQIVLSHMVQITPIGLSKTLNPLKENLKAKIKGVYNNIDTLDYHNIYNNNIYNNMIHDRVYHNNDIINDKQQNIKESSSLKLQKPNPPENNFSQMAVKAYDHILELFPEKTRPKTEAQKNKWLDCLDKLERIDGYSLQVVYFITKKARSDSFWADNFLSIMKLRQTNKQGVKYVDIFKMKFAKDIPDKIKNNE